MTNPTRTLALALPLIVAACGSALTEEDFTNESINIMCDKTFECYTAEELEVFAGFFGADSAECVTIMTALVEDGEETETECVFDADAAQTCLDDAEAQSCDDLKAGTAVDSCADLCAEE